METRDRNTVYPIWLRFFALAAALAAFAFIGPSSLFSNTDSSLPWNEQERIWPEGQSRQVHLYANQPKLVNAMRYKAGAEQDEKPRGEISILVYPDGTVKGVWNGEYDGSDGTHYLIMAASFAGNIDPSKKFIENGKRDQSMLYFITAGAYNLVETTSSGGHPRDASGFLYVRGWLDPNYTAVGELIITKNKKSFETFSWAARPVN